LKANCQDFSANIVFGKQSPQGTGDGLTPCRPLSFKAGGATLNTYGDVTAHLHQHIKKMTVLSDF